MDGLDGLDRVLGDLGGGQQTADHEQESVDQVLSLAVQDLSCSLKVIMFIFCISLNLTSLAGSVNLQLK